MRSTVVLAALLSAACAVAADVYVKADAATGGNGSASAPYRTIQEAVGELGFATHGWRLARQAAALEAGLRGVA